MDCVGKIVAYDVVQLFCDFFLPFVDGQLIDGAFFDSDGDEWRTRLWLGSRT